MGTDLARLQTELSVAHTDFLRAIKQLEPDKRNQPGVSGQWSPKNVVSHLIGWDNSLQAFIAAPDEFNPAPLYDINTFNAESVWERQHQSWEETIDELQNSHIDLQKALTTVRAETKIYDRVCGWSKGRKEDYEFHTTQMEVWLKQNAEVSTLVS